MPKATIILVAPQMGENIGAAARAMLNFGLSDLRLVNPRDGWPSTEATANSAGALDTMPEVEVFDTLQQALHDQHYALATTARPRDLVKPVFTPQEATENIQNREEQNIALVFGGERSGLSNDDLALCHGIITIPTNPDFSSLNLAQSVLLVCSEIFNINSRHCTAPSVQSMDHTHKACDDDKEVTPAHLSEFDNFFTRLQSELETADFFKAPDLKPTMLRNIRTMLLRADLTDQELRTLHGILSALKS